VAEIRSILTTLFILSQKATANWRKSDQHNSTGVSLQQNLSTSKSKLLYLLYANLYRKWLCFVSHVSK